MKSLRTPIFKNCSNGRDWRKMPAANLACLLCIRLSEASLKAFPEQHYLKIVKLRHIDKNADWIRKREIRKRKATKSTRKDFELLSYFETSTESELVSDKNLLTWFIFWVSILESWLFKSRLKRFCNNSFLHVVTFEMSPKFELLNKI